jgi:hypothetical protein
MKTNKINKDRFIINKDVAINEYREYIKDSSLHKDRVECRFYKINYNSNDGLNISFKKVTSLHIAILVDNYKCNWEDFNIPEKSKFFLEPHLKIQNENDLINLIDEFNFIVKNSSFKKLENVMLIANKFPRHKERPFKTYSYKAKFINNNYNKAKYQKTKTKTLPRKVLWDLGEDLEFVNEQDVKRFKACFVWYYMYAKKPKYINRSKTVEKYKLMFEKMNKMISEERYLEHLGRSL